MSDALEAAVNSSEQGGFSFISPPQPLELAGASSVVWSYAAGQSYLQIRMPSGVKGLKPLTKDYPPLVLSSRPSSLYDAFGPWATRLYPAPRGVNVGIAPPSLGLPGSPTDLDVTTFQIGYALLSWPPLNAISSPLDGPRESLGGAVPVADRINLAAASGITLESWSKIDMSTTPRPPNYAPDFFNADIIGNTFWTAYSLDEANRQEKIIEMRYETRQLFRATDPENVQCITTFIFRATTHGGDVLEWTGTIPDNSKIPDEWQHLAICIDAEATRMFVNGVNVTRGDYSVSGGAVPDIQIDGFPTPNGFFTGEILGVDFGGGREGLGQEGGPPPSSGADPLPIIPPPAVTLGEIRMTDRILYREDFIPPLW